MEEQGQPKDDPLKYRHIQAALLIQCACFGEAGEVSERENLFRFICIVKLLSEKMN